MDVVSRWHEFVANNDPAALDALIADDAVFHSPAMHMPQIGKALTVKYLTAAMAVLNRPGFRYIGEWRGDDSAVLEFEVTIDDVHIDGIDMIGWNADGRITSFKVMLRPLKALHAVLPLMGAQLSA